MEIITDAVVATALFVNLIEDFAYFFAVKQGTFINIYIDIYKSK